MKGLDHFYNELKDLKAYQLFRIKCLISDQLEDPTANKKNKAKFYIGQKVNYFDTDLNKLIEVEILKIKRSNVSAREVLSGKRWTMPFYMIQDESDNIAFQETVSSSGPKVDRISLRKNDPVSFINNDGIRVFGKIIKLNPSRAKVELKSGAIWNVYYQSLSRIIDGTIGAPKLSLPDIVIH